MHAKSHLFRAFVSASVKHGPMKRRILLKGGELVTMNPERQTGLGDVLIEEDRILGLGESAQGNSKIDETIDCTGRLVLPGFIQPHTHLCQTLFRGYADDPWGEPPWAAASRPAV